MNEYALITITELIEKIKVEMCTHYCKYEEECSRTIDEGRKYPCPLNWL